MYYLLRASESQFGKKIHAKPLTGSVLAKFFREMLKNYVTVTESLVYVGLYIVHVMYTLVSGIFMEIRIFRLVGTPV